MASNPGNIHRQMAELLRQNPDGLSSGQIRAKLGIAAEEQAQLDRRRRELRRWFVIEKVKKGNELVYRLVGEREKPIWADNVGLRLRASVLGRAHGRCQMCGRTVQAHGIALVVDHKIPKDWGGSSTDEDNLWALCEDCNAGKKSHFSSQNQGVMRAVMHHKSVHVRIGELLKLNLKKPIPSALIELVAGQEDWRKRTRELRYLGWEIEATRKKLPSGKVESYYTLNKFTDWPDDPSSWIRDYERKRAQR
jgi:5-methylcytosine-specific restriction endonuclease McrA